MEEKLLKKDAECEKRIMAEVKKAKKEVSDQK